MNREQPMFHTGELWASSDPQCDRKKTRGKEEKKTEQQVVVTRQSATQKKRAELTPRYSLGKEWGTRGESLSHPQKLGV